MELETKATIAAILLFAQYIFGGVLAHKGYFTKWQNKHSRVEKAKQLGHAVKATLVKGGFFSDEDNGRIKHTPHGTYEYIVDGKKYEYRKVFTGTSGSYPPTSITVYYLDNPKKAFYQDRISIWDFAVFFPWIVCLLFMAI